MEHYEPSTGNGHRVLPITDPAERALAEHIGAVVMKAGELDATASAFVELRLMRNDQIDLSALGKSGEELTKKLKAVEQDTPEARGFGDRYGRLYEVRNHVIHSFRPVDDLNTAQRLIRRTKAEAGGRIEDRVIGIPELVDLWYDLRDFRHDIFLLFIEYATRWKPTPQDSSPEAR
ncbi:hypothetical protein ACU610_18260 [Geodermatophilus sp. URMC 61]|uniref:hypothetical protein n=1 Tax=Geodermatophilus sp. URMC 61 TaxID=3423411 RepID=UPI00406C3961